MKRFTMILCLLLMTAGSAGAAVTAREIDYRSGDTILKGYLAYDSDIQGQRPGILVVHEWWGLNDYARMRARMLAELGYTALAVDMYGEGKTATHPDTAAKFSSAVTEDFPVAQKRFMAGLEVLKQQPTVDPEKIAAIGYCFGGGIVLGMARSGVDIDGVVSFHGTLGVGPKAKPGTIKTRILVLNGADDPFVTVEQIASFKHEMDEAGADYRIINYPGAKHSFTNPQADEFGRKFELPLAYNARADRESWQAMQDFFKEIFRD